MKMMVMRRGGKLPELATEGSIGFDCFADVVLDKNGNELPRESKDVLYTLHPGEVITVGLGFAMEAPAAHGGFLLPRSGKGSKGLHLANVVGLIDGDYRAEVLAKLFLNPMLCGDPVKIRHGEAVCQMAFLSAWIPKHIQVVNSLSETARGAGGFGSTEGKV